MSNKESFDEVFDEVVDEVNKWANEELERRGILMSSEVFDKFVDLLEQHNYYGTCQRGLTEIKETDNILNEEG